MDSPKGKFYCLRSPNGDSRPVLVLDKPDRNKKVEIARVVNEIKPSSIPSEIRILYPIHEILADHPPLSYGRKRDVSFAAVFHEGTYLELLSVPFLHSLEDLTPIIAKRQFTEIVYHENGRRSTSSETVRKQLSLPALWLHDAKGRIMRLEIIEVARKKRIDEELTRKSDVMEGQLKTVKQKVKELERQIAKSKLANPCITKEPFEPRGKVFNFASQTKHNPESYREVPEGARGHMVVVLDTAQHGGTCKVWVVTITSKPWFKDIDFCPICPTPLEHHRLQVLFEDSQAWVGPSPLGKNSWLRVQPFLMPFKLLLPRIERRQTLDASGNWIFHEDQPTLTKRSLEQLSKIMARDATRRPNR